MKRSAPAAERNREPILAELRTLMPKQGTVLEVASGTGQHAVFFAEHLPGLTWQPSDHDPGALESIAAWVEASGLPNVRPPLTIDVTSSAWGIDAAAAIFCANMVHISPWRCTEGLFAGARRLLREGTPLITYGPYKFDGAYTAPSNDRFDDWLKSRDPSWGVRDTADLKRVAEGFDLEQVIDMPANNHILVWRRLPP